MGGVRELAKCKYSEPEREQQCLNPAHYGALFNIIKKNWAWTACFAHL